MRRMYNRHQHYMRNNAVSALVEASDASASVYGSSRSTQPPAAALMLMIRWGEATVAGPQQDRAKGTPGACCKHTGTLGLS